MKTRISSSEKEIVIKGIGTSPGIAQGKVFVFRSFNINITELEMQAEDVEQEKRLFDKAIAKVKEQVIQAQSISEAFYNNQFNEIFESQKAFLDDDVLIREIKEEIKDSNLSAISSVFRILSVKSDHFIQLENTYFKERAYDVIDLKQKLIHALMGIDSDYQLNSPSIVVADMLTPSDTIHFNRNFILGFLSDKGGKTSHAAILARGLKIPSVVNGNNLSQILRNGDYVIIDGTTGTIIIHPEEKTKEKYRKLQDKYAGFTRELQTYLAKPALTTDEQPIELLANIELTHEIVEVEQNKADGVGLFRTESMFIEKKGIPDEAYQFEHYKHMAEKLNPAPLVIRTIDLGGDKFLENYSAEDEMNPFLGWRAIRFCLDEPDIFKTQLRAILRASAFGNIKILIPMVSAVNEILRSKKIIDEIKNELSAEALAFNKDIQIGIMIETPAAAMSVELYIKYVDFFSIGTNDLTQYVLAIDRTNSRVSKSFNTFNPAVLDFIYKTIKTGRKHQKEVTLCGEFAAMPEAIPLLLGMGLRSFSMNPVFLAKSKKIIRSLDIRECEMLFDEARQLDQAELIEKKCLHFIESKVPDLKYLI